MIVKPLLEVQHALLGRKVVIVIDALDECESSQGVRQLLDLLTKEELNLPIKIFLSSRPESGIYPRVNTFKGKNPRPHLILHELATAEIYQDIETYFRAELQNFDIPASHIARLAVRAGVLFIYASTAVKYIQEGVEQGELEERLATMLGLTSISHSLQERDIDMLYETILARAFDNPRLENESKDRMVRVLWIIICAQEPLTVSGIAALLRPMTTKIVQALIQPLLSVLHVTGSNALVTTLHASFPDFILNQHRSARFHRAAPEYHSIMCRAFDVIGTHIPQFNVCALESSFYLDREVVDLEKRTNKAISTEMYYACRHWAAHLESSGKAADLETPLRDFLSVRLLLWMEIQ
ncbi:vegetative incompatibility protein HET-E-1, partial [Rhizoctonia solani AG-3 Rhs1AP]